MVFHAARQDLEIFYVDAGVIPAPPLRHPGRRDGVCGFGEAVGYETLSSKIAKHTARQVLRASPTGRAARMYGGARMTYARPM